MSSIAPSQGRELLFVYSLIKEKIGVPNFLKAKNKKNSVSNMHMIEVLQSQEYISENDSAKIIYEGFKKYVKNIEICLDDSIVCNTDGSFSFNNEKVRVCVFPEINQEIKQVIVPFSKIKILESGMTSARKSNEHKIEIKQKTNFTFKDIVRSAMKKNASDIHINFFATSNKTEYNILFSIDGDDIVQYEYMMDKEQGKALIDAVRRNANEHTKGEFTADAPFLNQTGHAKYDDLNISLRAHFYPDGKLDNYAMVARILYPMEIVAGEFDTKGELGYDEKFKEAVKKVTRKNNGLVIITGVVGSGKTMLGAQMLASISPKKKINVYEDPIEYPFAIKNLVQTQKFIPPPKKSQDATQYPSNTPSDFVTSMKRSAPKVLSMGEWRKNEEQSEAIIEAAESGNMVYVTIHTRSATGVYNALTDLWHVPYRIAVDMIEFASNQVLVKKLCSCKKKDGFSANIKKLQNEIDSGRIDVTNMRPAEIFIKNNAEGEQLYVACEQGCEKCNYSGYKGRTPVYEYFIPTLEFKNWLLEKRRFNSEIEEKTSKLKLGTTKLETFLQLVKKGKVDISEVVLENIF